MNIASPAQMRKALEAVEHLKKAGILFVPIPVISEADHEYQVTMMFQRLEEIEQDAVNSQVQEDQDEDEE